jgi:hypothetical protein
MSLWLCLEKKPGLAMAAAALSLAFKLQLCSCCQCSSLFIFGQAEVCSIWPIFPAVYLLAVSPAVIAGRGFLETLLILCKQRRERG